MRTRMQWTLTCGIGCALVLLLAAPGCGRQSAPRTPPDLPTEMPSEEEAERVREDAREAIPILPEGERGLSGEDLPPEARETDAEREPDRPQRYGYRVQLFATSDRALAEQRAAEYREMFDAEVYVEFEGILYKVRVGDCLSRDEADALRREALGLGHEGAFIVDTLVHIR
ncbi:MAG: hypothetical protein GF330_11895 [Candidatus Eisenbacteria bacterium]|nr:hypothetical protein [Candidatus Eisenbacteria bacterium]